jgi:hypothetical protein
VVDKVVLNIVHKNKKNQKKPCTFLNSNASGASKVKSKSIMKHCPVKFLAALQQEKYFERRGGDTVGEMSFDILCREK